MAFIATEIEDTEEIVASKGNWYVMKFSGIQLGNMRELLNETHLKYFLPSYVALVNASNGQKRKTEKALLFNMFFVFCTLREAATLVENHHNISFLLRQPDKDTPSFSLKKLTNRTEFDAPYYDDASFRRVISIPNHQMEMFIKAVEVREHGIVPYVKPSEVDLLKGDLVRIIGGKYDGVEGILESQQGKDGGIVYVHIKDLIATSTTYIEPDFLQILSFAKKGKHMYKKFDSFMIRGERSIFSLIKGDNIPDRDKNYFYVFTKRFENLKTETLNMQAKLLLFMAIAHKCLGNNKESCAYELQLRDFATTIKSDMMRAKCYVYLYAITKNADYREEFIKIKPTLELLPNVNNDKKTELFSTFDEIEKLIK